MTGDASEHGEAQALGDLFAGAQHVATDPADLAHARPADGDDRDDHDRASGAAHQPTATAASDKSEQHARDRLCHVSPTGRSRRRGRDGSPSGATPIRPTAAPRPTAWAATAATNIATRAGQRSEADDAKHDRAAQRGDAVAAVAGVLQDLQAALDVVPPANASATSARPSSWNAPVISTPSSTATAAATTGARGATARRRRRRRRRRSTRRRAGTSGTLAATSARGASRIGMRVRNWTAASRPVSRTTRRTSAPR